MFEVVNRRTSSRTVLQLLELIFFWTMREVGGKSRNPLLALLGNAMQAVVMILAFFILFSALGMRRSPPIRGDMMMFLASGIMLFLAHNQALMAVFRAEGPDGSLMQHAPMNTFVAIASSALGALYRQIVTTTAILVGYQLYSSNVDIDRPVGFAGMVLLAWWAGVCAGIFLRAIKLFLPGPAPILQMTYVRMNMIFSGKMMPANTLPAAMLPMFDWNPLFHTIDAARGYVFLNYTAHRADLGYVFKVCAILFVLGMLGDFYARQMQRRALMG